VVPSKSTERSRSSVVEPVPLSWSDVVGVQEDHGVRPVAHRRKRRSPEADAVHSVYAAWEREQGSRVGIGYVMPLCSLYLRLTHEYRSLGRHESGRRARRDLVDAINDPYGGLEVRALPFHPRRRAS